MAFLEQSFSVADLPVSTNNFEPLPAGWYTASIAGAEIKNTKAGTGQFIAVKYTITGPSFQGRVVFGNLNIKNPNVKAEEIGRQQLGEIMRAIGLAKVTDTDQLIGGNISIKLEVKRSEEYGDSNEIKQFKAMSGAGGAMPVPSAAGVAAAAPTRAAPPWGKK
jgi:hypothetical protein